MDANKSCSKITLPFSGLGSWDNALDVTNDNGCLKAKIMRCKVSICASVRRQLSCPVGDNYLDRLTDM